MDDIDKAKLGKKDEILIGWDHLRYQKGIGTNYPPMHVKETDVPGTGLPYTYIPPKHNRFKDAYETVLAIFYLAVSVVILIIAVVIAIKILGY